MKPNTFNASNVYELTPTNGRKSFYGKAKVIICGGWSFLKSYETIMCGIDASGKVHKYSGHKTNTTCSHLISYLGENYKGFWDMPCELKPTIVVKI